VGSLTWLGHASCFVRLGETTLLTDPVFSARCSPVQFSGPLRYVAVPCPAAEIPTPGFVLISHDHYDHLDYNTITALEDNAVVHGRPRPVYVMGLGLKSWFVSNFGIEDSRLVELDWWQSYSPSTHLSIDFVPAQHWGKRSLLTHMDHLWGGFVVKDAQAGKSFFFAGDTGFSEQLFAEIGNRYGPVDMAAIPIGAYEPRWFMAPQHVDPEQAHAIHRLVKAKHSVGIHWGTFILTDEPVDEPRTLINQINENNAGASPFATIEHGATINF
jgi:L-ascorbate metabolism protein UlaG (beta-lactamase superfamily)